VTSRPRTLRSYLLLPRPHDAVKWWILPLTFGLGVLARGGVSEGRLTRALVVWAVLELLVYQARYQLNDIRGFAADQRHPSASARGRLPGPVERARPHIAASAAVAIGRLAAAAAVGLLVPVGGGRAIAALSVAVLGVAAVYEALRSRATGRSDRVPPPVRPGVVALWVVVGAGYAIRGVGGLALAVDLGGRPLLAAAAALTMWAFGIAFVTARWALEAMAFARADGGRIAWSVRADHAREHSLTLVRWLPSALPAGTATPADWRPLAAATPMRAPWNLAVLVSATAAAATGRLLAGGAGAEEALVAAAMGGILGAGVLLAVRRRARAVLWGAVLLAGCGALDGWPRPVLAALPWAAICAAHLLFAGQSLGTLGHPLRAAVARARRRMPGPVAPPDAVHPSPGRPEAVQQAAAPYG
jgi:hypothetical protein